jgi:hypothetical protein
MHYLSILFFNFWSISDNAPKIAIMPARISMLMSPLYTAYVEVAPKGSHIISFVMDCTVPYFKIKIINIANNISFSVAESMLATMD